jgi:hypothetical protein
MPGFRIGGEYKCLAFGHIGIEAMGGPGALGRKCCKGEDVVMTEQSGNSGVHGGVELFAKVY